jgi:hypothetical protein
LDEQRPARTRSDSGARGAMISASVDIGCDDRESPSIGADQRRRGWFSRHISKAVNATTR